MKSIFTPKHFFALVFSFYCFKSIHVTAQHRPSIHQEQSQYYAQFGAQHSAFYDSLQQYDKVKVQHPKNSCALDKIVFGWHPYWVGSAHNNYDWSLLSDLSYFSYEVDPNTGNAITTNGWATAPAVDAALQNGVRVNLCVTMFSGHNTFFGNASSEQNLISNLINLVQSRGAHGVNIDFEGIPSAQRTNFTNFMIDLATQMHTAIPGSQVSTVLYAVDWNNVFDIAALTPHVDLFVIMGYGYYYSGSSTAGPTDPLFPFESNAYQYTLARTIGYYLKEGLPKEKLVMGLPYYGREWTTTSSAVPSSTIGSIGARTYAQVQGNSNGYYNNELWHEASKTPYFSFNDGTNWRQCFALNAQSFADRLDNIRDYDIGGMGIWALGYDNGYTDLWNVIAAKMTNCYSLSCSDTLYDMGGAYRNYYNGQDYIQTIDPSNGTYPLNVNFLNFDLESNYDYLYLYDGTDTNATFIGVYSGNNGPGSFTANSGALTLRFFSDGATTAPGWQMAYNCNVPNNILPDTILMGAETNTTLNCGTAYQLLYDSGGKNGNYSNNENYSQTLCNSDSTKAVRISFRPQNTAAIQIRMSSTQTGNDYIYLYNGPDTTANLIGAYTGTTAASPQPGTFISSGHCITLVTHSDATDNQQGFEARVYCTDRAGNNLQYAGGSIGSVLFEDDGGSSNYSNNLNEMYTFCPHSSSPSDEVIWAEFNDTLGIEHNWDYLYVFDGNSADAPLLNVYTGDTNHINIIGKIGASTENSSGCLSFQFFSDGATTASGWNASIYTDKARLAKGKDHCSAATLLDQENKIYAGSTVAAAGLPGQEDPTLNISIASLPECSGSNTITRIENSVWYTFHTIDSFCFVDQIALKLSNISCQSVTGEGSGLQMVLYESSACASGINWGTPVYCADKLLNGDSVVINSLLNEQTTYYLMIDGFSGQNCNFDILLENKDTSGCMILNNPELSKLDQIQIYPNPGTNRLFIHTQLNNYLEAQLNIYNVNGQLLQNRTIQKKREMITLESLSPGMYILEIKAGNKSFKDKFIKL